MWTFVHGRLERLNEECLDRGMLGCVLRKEDNQLIKNVFSMKFEKYVGRSE